ncbi:hypothetical protein PRIPAC_84677 [Pristionchus pacificus]|uniref:Uncharacterized protein n=1 Tax=Pristionchus pacificus TaxID=54126 RepID=A0A2A6BMY2_PRIPA|nr:hypothetical protein PRIPAC_84677 [Pristionchus pacificus]|eukprot:PDM67156.1 hypothetical protein PRIPAC_48573 [Pristionchus pacificus]
MTGANHRISGAASTGGKRSAKRKGGDEKKRERKIMKMDTENGGEQELFKENIDCDTISVSRTIKNMAKRNNMAEVRVFVSSKEWKGHWEVDYESFPPQNLEDYFYPKFFEDRNFKIGEKLNQAILKTKGFRPREIRKKVQNEEDATNEEFADQVNFYINHFL